MTASDDTPPDPFELPTDGSQTYSSSHDKLPPPRYDAHLGGTTAEQRNWAMASHLGCLLAAWVALGLLAPLTVLLVKGAEPGFVRSHAMESLNFQINALVYTVIFGLLIFVVIGLVLLPLYGAFYLVCVVIASYRASHGEAYRYPMTIRVIS